MAPILSLKVIDSKYATTELNVRTQANADSSVVAVVKKGTKLSVTKTISNGFRYVSYHDKGRWVKNQYLSDTKPKSTTSISSSSSSSGVAAYPELPVHRDPRSKSASLLTPSGSIAPSAIATPRSPASWGRGPRVVTTEKAALWTA